MTTITVTRVELRKAVDTWAGACALAAIGLITAIVVIASCLSGPARGHGALQITSNALQPALILLPLVAMVLVTAEWSQRTAMITFALVPVRTRVAAAKLAAGLILALGALMVVWLGSAAGVALLGGDGHPFALPGWVL